MLTNHLKQEHPNIYETYQKYRRRRVPRSLQQEALNIEETYHIEVNKEHIPITSVEVKKEHITTLPIEIKKEHIPIPPIEIKEEHIPIPPIEIKEEPIPIPPTEVAEQHILIPPTEITEDIPTTPMEKQKDNDSNQEDCQLAPYVKMLFKPPYFQIVSIARSVLKAKIFAILKHFKYLVRLCIY